MSKQEKDEKAQPEQTTQAKQTDYVSLKAYYEQRILEEETKEDKLPEFFEFVSIFHD